MLTLWGRSSAFNVQKVRWLLLELGVPYDHIQAGGSHSGLDDPSFRAMNPHGKVPVVQDGGTIVWESHAILRYLAASFGGAQFWPAVPAARAQADGWMDWVQTGLQPTFLTGVFWGYFRTPEAERDTKAVAAAIAKSGALFKKLEDALTSRDFLGGEQLGLADIPAGTHLYRYFGLDIDRPALPNVESWYARLQERDAYRQAVMLPFDDMRGRTAY